MLDQHPDFLVRYCVIIFAPSQGTLIENFLIEIMSTLLELDCHFKFETHFAHRISICMFRASTNAEIFMAPIPKMTDR